MVSCYCKMKDVTSGVELNAQGNDYNLEEEKYVESD